MNDLGKRLYDIRVSHGLTLDQLAERLNATQNLSINKGMISRWENGRSTPYNTYLIAYAKEFNLDMNYLLGVSFAPGYEVVDMSSSLDIPVMGRIPAGVPIDAVEDVISTIQIPEKWVKNGNEFIGLQVNGDSMYPTILNGDTVIIRLQPTAETGDVCACYVNGYDATLKRINISEEKITLKPDNPNYAPLTYPLESESVTILGKVVEVRRKF